MALLLCRDDNLPRSLAWRAGVIGLAIAGAAGFLQITPTLRIGVFAAGAARLAAILTGADWHRGEGAALIVGGDRTVAVTDACSGTDFFLMVAALLAWRLWRADRTCVGVVLAGFALALPVTLFVNALRVVVVTQAHRWLIPLLPERYGAFTHLAAGVAIFLPALIALNLALETYAKRHRSATS